MYTSKKIAFFITTLVLSTQGQPLSRNLQARPTDINAQAGDKAFTPKVSAQAGKPTDINAQTAAQTGTEAASQIAEENDSKTSKPTRAPLIEVDQKEFEEDFKLEREKEKEKATEETGDVRVSLAPLIIGVVLLVAFLITVAYFVQKKAQPKDGPLDFDSKQASLYRSKTTLTL